ncbi:MAG TPA: hypothetical protein VK507_23215 [Iamia sp.]|nr:hypothetical protein [Iamia sp.]
MTDLTEDTVRDRLARLGDAMDIQLDDGGPSALPGYGAPASRRRWWPGLLAAAATVAALAVAGVALADSGSSDTPEAADGRPTDAAPPAADQPALPDPDAGTTEPEPVTTPPTEPEPVITQPIEPGEMPVAGGEPTPAVTYVGDQLGARLVRWEHLGDEYWAATYEAPRGTTPTNIATFSSGSPALDRPTGEEAVDVYLPGADIVEVDGAEQAFFRGDDQAGILSMVVGDRFYSLTAGRDHGLDRQGLIELGATIIRGLPEA